MSARERSLARVLEQARQAPYAAAGHNLPPELSSFVGRQADLNELRAMLRTNRLVTLVGPAGVGKSRLAVRVARELIGSYRDGVWLLDLVPIREGALVPKALAAALRIDERAGQELRMRLVDALRSANLLLVFDNCEHLVGACGDLISDLLLAAPEVEILAASREPLGIVGEVARRIAPLASPPPAVRNVDQVARYDSVRLFVHRLGSLQPNFAVEDGNVAAVVEICNRLDGIPLALELAAARGNVLTVQQIAARLDDRFRLLKHGSQRAPGRHRTLRTAVEWSHELLTPDERRLFERLAVFTGGFSLEAVERVCVGDGLSTEVILELLARLIDKSFVIAEPDLDWQMHYRLLESLREFGLEQLNARGDTQRMRQRHAEYLLVLVEEAASSLTGSHQGSWLVRLEREHDNLRSALQWAASTSSYEVAVRIAVALGRFWWLRGHFAEGQRWLTQILGIRDHVPPVLQARLLNAAGCHLGLCLGQPEEAALLHTQALELWRSLDDARGIAWSLHNLGLIARDRGDLDEAQQLFAESLAIYRASDDVAGATSILRNLGLLALEQTRHSVAQEFFQESLSLARTSNDAWGAVMSSAALAGVMVQMGNLPGARAAIRDSLGALAESEAPWSLPYVLRACATVEAAAGEWEVATQVLGAAESFRSAAGAPLGRSESLSLETLLTRVRSALHPTGFASAWARGAGMTAPQVVDFVRELDDVHHLTAANSSEPPFSAVGRSMLTRRETQIARMVARGLTNRQIAEALVISERTTENHLGHIFDKLGVTSRAQVATWAVMHGLLASSSET